MEKHPDLFGGESKVVKPVTQGKYALRKQAIGYLKVKHETKSCRTCRYRITHQFNGKNYHKCQLIGESRSQATDIVLHAHCRKHEPEE